MPYPNISENNRTVGKLQLYFDPLHQQIVALTTVEVFRKTVAQLQTEIDTVDENMASQIKAKQANQTILDGVE